jgi:hypothetical protein
MRKVLLFAGLLALPAGVSMSQGATRVTVDERDPRLQRLRQFFAKRHCPLHEAAAEFLIAADENELDWRLLPSISIVESGGGKDYTNNNVFGWDSCRESFTSVTAGIHFVAARLANSQLYKNKGLNQKLSTYNPRPDYPVRVRALMESLGTDLHGPRFVQYCH